ncbi:MAG TPA: hypothetical protein VLZ77_04155 [Acidimicrobiales bacterium]|nr:hypothetical protein [Acidimicrobiales bacterium]
MAALSAASGDDPGPVGTTEAGLVAVAAVVAVSGLLRLVPTALFVAPALLGRARRRGRRPAHEITRDRACYRRAGRARHARRTRDVPRGYVAAGRPGADMASRQGVRSSAG